MYKLKIKKYRIKKKLTQKELAHRIEMSQNYYCELENNKYDIKLSVLCKIARELNVNTKALFECKK
ncbi:helix-turn-helix domain-containing protein [Clostridium botulinum]|uniref:helix-turn-helix domain-containing protein n=1 Tax=Clostridium botulinum TaxID=1491 RepID=UPI00016B9665|nr:helix-turn-helix transcriptional regulator [Clostridium botulinum]EDT87197.1 putative helix-turn-helix protein [Clostridium botulinum Bf]MBY6797055.1 helix-turn-helix transcriptional regulator [Clostridium botulinum]MBY6866522.1 helix-turn-helix transcriptional regulator [Clostridium botulinum]MBY6873021.1 helix-turn-helix transcriptional regulator [Clostridium botulinum]MBY6881873.1 helix-turn-helix transcriptional regulator [Clostridium botulinum]